MLDPSILEDTTYVQEEYPVQSDHFEWEKQYLTQFFNQINFGIKDIDQCLEKTYIEYNIIINKKFKEYERIGQRFNEYLQNQRKSQLKFTDKEMDIIQNNHEFQDLIIKFHKSVDILIKIECKIMDNQNLISHFSSLDTNIQGLLFYLLEDLLKHTMWEQKLQQLLLNNFDKQLLHLTKSSYLKQQTVYQRKNVSNLFTILIIGAVGTGKSRLAQQLFDYLSFTSADQKVEQFKEGDRLEGVTKDVNRQSFNYGDSEIDLIDTPGCGDMETGLKLVFEKLTSSSNKIDLIIFCMNAQILRLHRDDLCFLSIIQGIFNCSWDKFFICLNFMEQMDKEQVNQKNIISSFEKRLEINFSEKNLIIENNYSTKLQYITNIIEQFIRNKNQNSFKLKYIADLRFIYKRLDKYKM